MKRGFQIAIALVTTLILGSWLATPYVVVHKLGYNSPDSAGAFGDIFGAINSLFAGLAFLGVFIAVLLQAREIQQNRSELLAQTRAAERQAFLMATGAKLTALPILIRQEKERIWTIDKNWMPDFVHQDYHPDKIAALKADVVERINTIEEEVDITQKQLEQADPQKHDIYGDLANKRNRLADLKRKLCCQRELIPRLESLRNLTLKLEEACQTLLEEPQKTAQ